MFQAGLVLEGGGMRGIFTAGVLDFFMDKGIAFAECYAVSAGSCHACSYLSGQRGRALAISTDYLDDKNYCSFYSLIRTGDLFNVQMAYHDIPERLNPYDYDAFDRCETKFYAVVTNCTTGEAEYMPVTDMRRDIDAVRASSSLPLLARMVDIGGEKYLDGGIADSIPIKRSIDAGNGRNVVVLTRDLSYRKPQSKMTQAVRFKYRRYPELVRAFEARSRVYNETLEYISALENAGSIFVIRPSQPLTLGRIEKDKNKLEATYRIGYEEAARRYDDMMGYLGR